MKTISDRAYDLAKERERRRIDAGDGWNDEQVTVDDVMHAADEFQELIMRTLGHLIQPAACQAGLADAVSPEQDGTPCEGWDHEYGMVHHDCLKCGQRHPRFA